MKQLQQLFGRWQDEPVLADETQPSKPVTLAPDSHVGAIEHQIEVYFNRGARVVTEISEVTPAEIHSKFVVQGVGITGMGITPREKYLMAQPAVGDVVTQEVESWEMKDGQCVAALRLISTTPHELDPRLQPLEDDRIDGMEGG